MFKKAFKQEDEWIEFLYFSPLGRVGIIISNIVF
jgi:hypothetical protein